VLLGQYVVAQDGYRRPSGCLEGRRRATRSCPSPLQPAADHRARRFHVGLHRPESPAPDRGLFIWKLPSSRTAQAVSSGYACLPGRPGRTAPSFWAMLGTERAHPGFGADPLTTARRSATDRHHPPHVPADTIGLSHRDVEVVALGVVQSRNRRGLAAECRCSWPGGRSDGRTHKSAVAAMP